MSTFSVSRHYLTLLMFQRIKNFIIWCPFKISLRRCVFLYRLYVYQLEIRALRIRTLSIMRIGVTRIRHIG